MGLFAYTGVDEKGRTVRGTVDADSVKAARASLRKKGIFLDEARPLAGDAARSPKGAVAAAAAVGGATATVGTAAGVAAVAPGIAQLLRRTGDALKKLASNPTQHVSTATRQLATLLKAGVPLPEALAALVEQLEHEGLRKAFENVSERVREGISFARALEDHKEFFEPLYVNMVAAGEASGNLDGVLARLADFSEAQVKLRNKISGALAYPAFMAVFGVVIIGVMMVVVVPKVSAIFEDFKKSLPWYTELLIGTSRFVGDYWWLIAGLVISGSVMLTRWRRTPEGAYKWDALMLRMPIFGELARMVAISRFARTLSTLLASGVPLLKAMEIVKNVLGNRVLEAVVTEAATSIREGESIAEPLKRSKRFPPIVTHMIAIGEKSGELEGMLAAVATSFDNTIDSRVAIMTSLLEPIMIAVLGGSAGVIAFSILMPLMQLNEFVQ